MRALATSALLAALGFAGCATNPPTPTAGNFATTLTPAFNETLVGDATSKLRALYPAASTQFELQQGTQDRFGSALIESLRASGYAVLEAAPAAQGAKPVKPAASGAAEPAQAPARGIPLRYIVDAPTDTNLYRLTLLLGGSSLSRAYMVTPEVALRPAGAWVRKE